MNQNVGVMRQQKLVTYLVLANRGGAQGDCDNFARSFQGFDLKVDQRLAILIEPQKTEQRDEQGTNIDDENADRKRRKAWPAAMNKIPQLTYETGENLKAGHSRIGYISDKFTHASL